MNKTLEIRDLHVSINDIPILRGVNLIVPPGEIHALMGPNGSGKSTLSYALMGHPAYEITSGEMIYGGVNIAEMESNERAREGIFLAFQYPHEIPGVRLQDFIRTATMAVSRERFSLSKFMDRLNSVMEKLQMDKAYLNRSLNEGFSGGEKKRAEILQMIMLQPTLAVLDETDSGLDIDALKIVAEGVNSLRSENFSALVITHYQRLLNYIKPDRVHVLQKGVVAMSGGPELALDLEKHGYEILREETALAG